MSPNVSLAGMTSLVDELEQYLRIERRRGALTVACYRAIVDDFVRYLASNPETSGLGLAEVTRLHCLGYLRSPGRTATEEPSRSVWNQRLAALRSLCQYLLDRELIAKNPTHGIERHKIRPREPIPLSLEEFTDLVEAAGRSGPMFRSRNVAIVLVLFNTAIRVSELVSLDVDQVSWDASLFKDVLVKGDKRLSKKFPALVAEALQGYLADRARRHPVSDGALFLSMRGTRLSVRAVEELVSELGRKAGIGRPVTPHLLRHSCVTELVVEQGMPLKVAQEICGHASLKTTERYTHARAGADRVAIDTLGAAVAKALLARQAAAQAA